MSSETLVLLAIAVPIGCALLLPIFRGVPNLREAVTMTAAIALAAIVLTLLPTVEAGGRPEVHLLDVAPGLAIAFKVEPLGMVFALVASLLWIVNSIY